MSVKTAREASELQMQRVPHPPKVPVLFEHKCLFKDEEIKCLLQKCLPQWDGWRPNIPEVREVVGWGKARGVGGVVGRW